MWLCAGFRRLVHKLIAKYCSQIHCMASKSKSCWSVWDTKSTAGGGPQRPVHVLLARPCEINVPRRSQQLWQDLCFPCRVPAFGTLQLFPSLPPHTHFHTAAFLIIPYGLGTSSVAKIRHKAILVSAWWAMRQTCTSRCCRCLFQLIRNCKIGIHVSFGE